VENNLNLPGLGIDIAQLNVNQKIGEIQKEELLMVEDTVVNVVKNLFHQGSAEQICNIVQLNVQLKVQENQEVNFINEILKNIQNIKKNGTQKLVQIIIY